MILSNEKWELIIKSWELKGQLEGIHQHTSLPRRRYLGRTVLHNIPNNGNVE